MELIQQLAAVVLVMVLLGGVLVLLKRRGIAAFHLPGAPLKASRRMEILERISLTPQHSLHLIRAEDRVLLIATAPGSCQILNADVELKGRT